MTIWLKDHRGAEPFEEVMHYEGGVEAFVRHLDKAKTPLLKEPIVIRGKRENVEIDLSLWWNDSYHENVLCFTNNIPQRDGGTHLAAFRSALTRIITGYAESSRRGQAREGLGRRRGRPRGPDLRAVGQGAGPEVLLADQGQAGLLRGAPGRRRPGRRGPGLLVRGAPQRGRA